LKDHSLFAKNVLKQPTVYHGLFASHPKNDKRLHEAVEKSLHLFPQELREPERDFWEMIDGLVYGNEAATGLIKGTSYYHGSLRVVIGFPENWDVANTATEVLGKAPGTSDANISVRLMPGPATPQTPAEYVAETLKQDVVDGQELDINGYKAFLASIEVTDGSAKARTIAVVFKESNVYLFRGEAGPMSDLEQFGKDWLATLSSFRAMTAEDLKVANSQRIKVVVASPSDTFASLAKKSSIKTYPAETLRVINGMHPIGEPRAGDFVKIVQ
ncbi:MAG: hypothetical protein KDI31_12855, partial [Pseudomonadales bacterium]|nr:hypothetical protein [Pseudomonadales bacterium]